MTLSNYQFSYNGLTFGAGSELHVVGISGLRDLPPFRATDTPHLRNPGDYYGIDVVGARTIQVSLVVAAPTDLETQLANLEAAFTPLLATSTAFTFQLPSQAQNRTLSARCRRRSAPIDLNYAKGYMQVTVELVAADPRIYDVTTQSTSISGTVANGGNFETRGTITLTSPAAGTTVTNSSDSSGFVKLQVLSGYSMPGTVVIDLNALTITDGTNLRMDLLDPSSTFFKLNPGSNSVTLAGGGTGSISWQSAWM